jgi:branched-chain amino acid transport system substrate-binding protein
VKRGILIGVTLSLFAFLLGPATWAADKPPVKIGVVQPLTGQGANVAKSWLEGMNLAVDMINKEGGILKGRKVQMVVEDDQCIPAQSVAATKKLIYEDKLKVILAAMCSSSTIADVPITKEAGAVQIVSLSYADSITEMGNPLLFRTCTTNKILADGMASKIANEFKIKSIAFYSVNDDYGRGLVAQTKKIFEKLGKPKILFEGFFGFNDRDFSAPITKMKGLKPEALYLIARFPQNAQILNQMAELGFKPKLFGPINLVADDCIKAAGKNVEGAYGVVNWANELDNSGAKKYLAAFKAKYGKLPEDDFSMCGYTGTMVASMAINKAGTDQDPQKIGAALRKLKWNAPNGSLSFDSHGQGTINVYIVQVKNGTRVLIK